MAAVATVEPGVASALAPFCHAPPLPSLAASAIAVAVGKEHYVAPWGRPLERVELRLLGRELSVFTDDALGVAGRVWPAQEVAALHLRRLMLAEGGSSERTCRCGTVFELGAGCGALSVALAEELGPDVRVVCSDLPEVVPLMELNCQVVSLSHLGSSVECRALRWGDLDAAMALLTGGTGGSAGGNGRVDSSASTCVVACEAAYWGGWDLFEEDTREPLAATLHSLITGPEGFGLLVHEVRDPGREAGLFELIRAKGLEVWRQEPRDAEPRERD
mmetsp:Transcript_100521/g.324213  ORF Transcript_100521/g.324213 Transcript_100521/m.324213 type:complete len:275 (+) Transcript_100521:80-904(+)